MTARILLRWSLMFALILWLIILAVLLVPAAIMLEWASGPA